MRVRVVRALQALATHHGTAQAAQLEGGLGASVLATCQALLSFNGINAVDLRATCQGKMAEEWAPGIRDCIAEMVSLLQPESVCRSASDSGVYK